MHMSRAPESPSMWSVLRPSELRRHAARWLGVPGSAKALQAMLRPRYNFMLRQNLDGSYVVQAAHSNPKTRRITLTAKGRNLEQVLSDIATQLNHETESLPNDPGQPHGK